MVNMYGGNSRAAFSHADFAAAIGFIHHLNAEELKEILNSDPRIDAIVKDLKLCKDVEMEKEMIIASNRSLAEYNLSKEPDMKAAKQHILELNATAEDLYTRVEEKCSLLKQKSSSSNVETALALVLTAAAGMEEELEGFANRFLQGEVEVEAFLDEFIAKRKLMHLRRVKADKMNEFAMKRPQPSFAGAGPSSVPSSSFYERPPMAPYPPYPR